MTVSALSTYKDIQNLTDEQNRLFITLGDLNIDYTLYKHPQIFTVEEGEAFKAEIPGDHGKCLFLKAQKTSNHYLVAAHIKTRSDLKGLAKSLNEKRFSFGKPDTMEEMIGVRPGSVTPLAVMNDNNKEIQTVVIDKIFSGSDAIVFHPLRNDLSLSISFDDLVKFILHYNTRTRVMDLK